MVCFLFLVGLPVTGKGEEHRCGFITSSSRMTHVVTGKQQAQRPLLEWGVGVVERQSRGAPTRPVGWEAPGALQATGSPWRAVSRREMGLILKSGCRKEHGRRVKTGCFVQSIWPESSQETPTGPLSTSAKDAASMGLSVRSSPLGR